MSALSHCQQCGRRLRDVIFCPLCRQSLCSCACLDEHVAHHRPSTATPVHPVKPAVENAASPERRELGVEGKREGSTNGSVHLKEARGAEKFRERVSACKSARLTGLTRWALKSACWDRCLSSS